MKRRHYNETPETATKATGAVAGKRGFAKRVATTAMAGIAAFSLAFALAGPVAIGGAQAAAAATSSSRVEAKTLPVQDAKAHEAQASSATVLVYLNGSDLESEAGEATADIAEMLESGIGKNANVVIETLGTKRWQEYGIASDRAQRYIVNQGKLELVDDSLGQLDTTSADTLSDFISWGTKNYPADRYLLVMWNHGAGPVYGFGYDEFQGDYAALTLDEIQSALEANSGVHFDMIGMDCCIMSSLETYQVLAPFCDYAVLSEDFEPGIGWSYTNWMDKLEQNPGIDTVELGKVIVDDMINAVAEDPENGDATLALVDSSAVPQLYSAWLDFAYENKEALLSTNYSQQVTQHGREGFGNSPRPGGPFSNWDNDASYVTMSDYFVTDIMAVASTVESDTSTALENALGNAIVHFNCTSGEEGMTGMGVTLPYGDAEFYDELVTVFTACGIDKSYVAWLEDFVEAEGASTYYDYSTFDDAWQGWDPRHENTWQDHGNQWGYDNQWDYGYFT